MNKILFTLLLLNSLLFGQMELQNAFPYMAFNNAIDFQNAGDCTNRIFIVEQAGIIKVFENDPGITSSKIFLDIREKVTAGNELGLLGLAFHPDYETNGLFYVNYTAPDPLRSVIAVYRVSETDPDSAEAGSELVLFEQEQPYANHNGGQLAFGPDGYLYIALGDGGWRDDPGNNAQTLTNLLGKILRIDVDNPETPKNYGIPSDNPFKDNSSGYREEIFAYGLRNPWRFSFDFTTGLLWCADVGQDNWEEINIIENGKNYGWRCYEGNHLYINSGCSGVYTPPLWEYPHGQGISVTGGYIYRGPNVPEISGKYIYADYGSRTLWALTYDGTNPASNEILLTAPGSPVSFGVDESGELYLCTFNGSNDSIYRFVPTAPILAPSGLTALSSGSSVNLSWRDNSGNEDGFKIERAAASEDFILIDSAGRSITNYTDNSAQSTDYRYRVFAFNSADISGYSNEACTFLSEVSSDEIQYLKKEFLLKQNYPNPFNPATTVEFNIPEESRVTISIINTLGETQDYLTDEIKFPGSYSYIWNSEYLPSGIYFIQMNAESLLSGKIFRQTIKAVFLK